MADSPDPQPATGCKRNKNHPIAEGNSSTIRESAPRSWVQGSSAIAGWHEDPNWQGAWGPNPPFHTPVFVLTHHQRPSIEREGGTTFHFIDASPTKALETAREAADG
jgi:dihydrofolate reductase